MMYWLTDAGRAPSGQLAGEDCLPFDRNNLAVVEIGGRWKVVEGTHWILDFGPGEGNARASTHRGGGKNSWRSSPSKLRGSTSVPNA